MSRIVLKFGGSSVGDSTNFHDKEHMLSIAKTIKDYKEEGHEVIVVVSAMAGATRALKNISMSIDNAYNTLDDDMVLTTGEQITTGVLCKLLNGEKFNIKSQGFLGWQLPIITDNVFGGATIKRIETKNVLECLKNNITPIIAGYQGITEDFKITTLGFDGSDTTAVAIGVALKANICQFYKDVRGIYTANPRRVPNSKKIDSISTKEMFVLSSLGARILHPNSLKTALDDDLTIKILPNFVGNEIGSTICTKVPSKKIVGITYFEHEKNRISISVVGKEFTKKDSELIIKGLNKTKIFAEIVNTDFDDMSITVEIGWIEQLDVALQSIHTLFGLDFNNKNERPAFRGIGKQLYRDPAVSSPV